MRGLLLGSERFVRRVRRLLDARQEDAALSELKQLRPRPALARFVREVADGFRHELRGWGHGRRVDDASRVLAAYLARCRIGFPAKAVALALGYRGHGGVSSAVARNESAGLALRRTVKKLARNSING